MMMNDLSKNLMSDEALEDVTGGKKVNKFGNNPTTKMKCKFCGFEVIYGGNFKDKEFDFECKNCHKKHALKPVEE